MSFVNWGQGYWTRPFCKSIKIEANNRFRGYWTNLTFGWSIKKGDQTV